MGRAACPERYAWREVRITVVLPDELGVRLRSEARRRGVSVAELTRGAIEHALPERPADGYLSFFDLGPQGGPTTDDARQVDEVVRRAISQRHLKRELPPPAGANKLSFVGLVDDPSVPDDLSELFDRRLR